MKKCKKCNRLMRGGVDLRDFDENDVYYIIGD